MARTSRHHPTRSIAPGALLAAALLLARGGAAQPAAPDAGAAPKGTGEAKSGAGDKGKGPSKEPTVTFTFPAPAGDKARLTVNAEDPLGRPAAFKVVVGAATQTFTRTTPRAARSIEVPADPRAFVRFGVEVPGAPASHALAMITPDSRPLLLGDACGLWDLATSGSSASATCVARERHCPTASHPSVDRALVLSQCGTGPVKFCVPDYRIDVAGEKGQKVRVSVEEQEKPAAWIIFKSARTKRVKLPSGGRCPGVIVESGSERVRLSMGWGQHALVRVSESGAISAEHVPPAAEVSSAGSD